jgi:hypothetical protein
MMIQILLGLTRRVRRTNFSTVALRIAAFQFLSYQRVRSIRPLWLLVLNKSYDTIPLAHLKLPSELVSY